MNRVTPLRVLLIEDDEEDAYLIEQALVESGYRPIMQRVETAEAMRAALDRANWDVLLADYRVPMFGALGAFAALKDTGRDIPFIVVSGAIGEETARGLLQAGVEDCVGKADLDRLGESVRRAVSAARTRYEEARAVRRREDRLRLAYEEARIGAWDWDLTGNVVLWSRNQEKLLGLPAGKLGKSFEAFLAHVHPEDRLVALHAFEQARQDQAPFSIDARMLLPNDQILWFELRGRYFFDEENRPVRMSGVNIDITDRKDRVLT